MLVPKKDIPSEIRKAINAALYTTAWTLQYENGTYDDLADSRKYLLKLDGCHVAAWDMARMIGCCGIYVSTDAFVGYDYQRLGIGTALNKYRIHVARKLGYGCLLCTDTFDDVPNKKIMRKNGYKIIHKFTNPRTDNKVFIAVYNL